MIVANSYGQLRCCLRNARGFTLLEVILATGILATVCAFTISMISSQLTTRNKLEIQNQTYHSLHVAMSHLYDDFRHVQIATANNTFNASSSTLKRELVWHSSSATGLMYFISHNYRSFLADSPESNIVQIRYEKKRDPNGKEQLWRTVDKSLTESISLNEVGTSQLLLDDLATFQVNFWNGIDFGSDGEWDTTQADFAQKIPKMVKIKLEIFVPLTEADQQKKELDSTTSAERRKISLETIVYVLRSAGEEQLKANSQEYKWR